MVLKFQAFGKGLSEIFAQAFFQKACEVMRPSEKSP